MNARRQIGLAFAEARVGEAQAGQTTSDLVQAGNILAGDA